VISNFIVQALAGAPIAVFGDGRQTRSFCYVDDMIEGLVRLMAAPDEVTGPVNLGNPDEVAIGDLAYKVIAMTGSGSTLVHAPLPEDDPLQRCPDISLARERLDWAPAVGLDGGLEKTIAYFRDLLQQPRA
jgi:UDP-glucuronate decarboxylase